MIGAIRDYLAETFQKIYVQRGVDVPGLLAWLALGAAIGICGVLLIRG